MTSHLQLSRNRKCDVFLKISEESDSIKVANFFPVIQFIEVGQ